MGKFTQFLEYFIGQRLHLKRLPYHLLIDRLAATFIVVVCLLSPHQILTAESVFLGGGYSTVTGQDAGLYSESPTRQKIDLSGTWHVSIDGGEFRPVEVPSAYDGVGELVYERTFEIPQEIYDNNSFKFVAYGINYYTEVTVNGISIGGHTGGYISFTFAIPNDVLRAGENSISILVNNDLRTRETLPIKAQMYTPKNYGGIFRDIYILVTPQSAILGKEIRTTFLDGYSVAEMNIVVILGQSAITVDDMRTDIEVTETPVYHISVEVIDRIRGTILAQSQRIQTILDHGTTVRESVQVIARNPRLWSPGQPDLYTVSIMLYRNGVEHDRKNIIYGFRDVEIRDGSVYLNGQIFRARGILYHEFHPERGSAVSYEDLERDVALMKIANINLVRIAYHPPHPYLLNLLNRYGMMCMIEIPAVNIPGSILANEIFQTTARSYMEQMIERDRHHPSVLAWGIGENLEMPHGNTVGYATSMLEHARTLDSRPVYAASQFAKNDITTTYLDIAVLSIPPGLTEGISAAVELWKQRFPEKPLFIGKLGYYVEPGNTGGYSDPVSYEAQARYLLQTMQLLRGLNVDGIVVSSFTDWRAERPSMAVSSEDRFMHTTGIVSPDRRQRKSYEVVRTLYRGERPPSFAIGETPGTTPFEYIVGGFIVLIGFAYMLNSSRRFRENVNRALLRPYNFYSDVRDQRILSGFNTIYLGLIISLTMAMIFASFIQQYSNNQIVDYIFTHLLIFDSVKLFLADTVHVTWLLIVLLTGLCFGLFIVVALIIKVGSFFVKTRVLLSHSLVITFWSALPLVAGIPLSMILYNVLETEFYVVPILSLLGVLLVWVLFRLLKGISIIYELLAFRVYIIGIFIIVTVNGIVLLICEYTQATFSYISFFIHMIEGFRF